MAASIVFLVLIIMSLHHNSFSNVQYTIPTNEPKYRIGGHTHNPHENRSILADSDLPVLPDMPFIGRDKELTEISSYLLSDSVYVIGIHGPPAFGKTTLAIHVGHELVKTGIPVRYVEISEKNLFKHSIGKKQKLGNHRYKHWRANTYGSHAAAC